jgi:heterodisulfide reductase subunit B
MSGRLLQSVVQSALDADADNVVKACPGCEAERKSAAAPITRIFI